MKKTSKLLEKTAPDVAPAPDRLEVVAGKVVATMNQPSAAQKRFNTLMSQIDTAQATATTLRQFLDQHASAHHNAMDQLDQENRALRKRMALFLDNCIQAASTTGKGKKLTPNQKQQAIDTVLSLCEQVGSEDTELQALVERYDPTSPEEEAAMQARRQQASQQLVQEMAASYMGASFAKGRVFDSPEEVLRAAMEHEQQQAEKYQAQREARKAKKPASPTQIKEDQKREDAQNALRTVFRQLASSLHPDREPDAQLRERKTALMSEVNAAYGRKDLSTLLRIQVQSDMLDAAKAATLSEAKLKAMCEVLTDQLRSLKGDNDQLRIQMQLDLGYPAYLRFREADVLASLQEEQTQLRNDLNAMRAELESLQDDKLLKAWIKEQTRIRKAQQREAQAQARLGGGYFDMGDILATMMRRR